MPNAPDELTVDLKLEELPRGIRRRVRSKFILGRSASESVRLVAARHALGWTLQCQVSVTRRGGRGGLASSAETVVVHHEVLLPHGSTVLVEARGRPFGHACERDPAFRWLRGVGAGDRGSWSIAGDVPLAAHRVLRALERHRVDCLDGVDDSLNTDFATIPDLESVPCELREAIFSACRQDRTGRVATMVNTDPALVRSLAIALGDCPSRWTWGCELAAPLALVVRGRGRRDVLASALECGRGLDATDARVARLGSLGRLCRDLDMVWTDPPPWPHLAAALDVICPESWLSCQKHGVEAWARAQCWSSAQGLPDAARRYVARYGGALCAWVDSGRLVPDAVELLAHVLVSEAPALLRERIEPNALVRRTLQRAFPVPVGVPDDWVVDCVHVRRIKDGRELCAVGRELRNCLAQLETAEASLAHLGRRIHLRCEWEGRTCLAELLRGVDGWWLSNIAAERNASLPDDDRRRVVDAIRAEVRLAGVRGDDDGEGADSLLGELAALADRLDPPLDGEASRGRRMEAAASPAYVADANRTRLPSWENL